MKIGRYIKRVFKFLVLSVVILFFTTGLLTYLFQDKIIDYFVQEANKSLKTTITYDDISLNFFAEFPQVSIQITNPMIAGTLPERPDTLAHIQEVYLSFDIMDLIDGKYEVTSLRLDNAMINMVKDLQKNVNFDIVEADTSSSKNKEFFFNLKEIVLHNVAFRYLDQPTATDISLKAINTKASLSIDSLINTQLDGLIEVHTIGLGDDNYFENKKVQLNMAMALNTEQEFMTFAPSKLIVEGAAFNMEGIIGYGAEAYTHISFEAEDSKISSLASLLPNKISDTFAQYNSQGEVYFNGTIKGKTFAPYTPKIDVNFGFKNASFIHPGFNQKITNASLNGSYTNGDRHHASTSKLELNNFTAVLNNHPVEGEFLYSNFEDPYLKLSVKGSFEANDVLNIYPIENITNAKGRADINVLIDGRLKNLKQNAGLGKVKTRGTINVEGLEFVHSLKNMPYQDISGHFYFNGNDLIIKNLEAQAGNSDLSFKGAFINFIAFLFLDDQPLIVKADFSSQKLDLDELLSKSFPESENENAPKKDNYVLSIPDDVNLDLRCQVNSIDFRRMQEENEISNVHCRLFIKDKKVTYNNMSLAFAGGKVSFDDCTSQNGYGITSTDDDHLIIKSYIRFREMDIHNTFYLFEDFKQKFITHHNLKGTLNADLLITKMSFDKSLKLDANQLDLDIFNLSITDGELLEFEPLVGLYDYLRGYKFGSLINLNIPKYFNKENLDENAFEHLRFEKLTNEISIQNRLIDIPKMNIESNVTPFVIKGNQTFDGEMNYDIDVNLKNYKKINRQQENLSQYGKVMEDQTKGIWVYTKINGNTEEYEFSVDQEKMKKEFNRTVKESLNLSNDDETQHYIAPDVDEEEGFLEEEEF